MITHNHVLIYPLNSFRSHQMDILETEVLVNKETKTITLGVTLSDGCDSKTYIQSGQNPIRCLQDIWKAVDCLHGSELGNKVYHELYLKYLDLVMTVVRRNTKNNEPIGFWYDEKLAEMREQKYNHLYT